MCPPCSDLAGRRVSRFAGPPPRGASPSPRLSVQEGGRCLPEPLPSPSLWLLFWHLLKVPLISFTLRDVSRGDQSPGSPPHCLTPHTAAWLLSWGRGGGGAGRSSSDPPSCRFWKGLSGAEPSVPPGTHRAGQPSLHLPRTPWLGPSHTFLPDSQEPTSWSRTVWPMQTLVCGACDSLYKWLSSPPPLRCEGRCWCPR